MVCVIGIRFNQAGKIYYFDPDNLDFEVGDNVVVETARGQESGIVTISKMEIPEEDIKEPLKKVIRKATPEDCEQKCNNSSRAQEALNKCREFVDKLHLSMKPISAQYSLDSKHITIFFCADKRVDFRQLVKELSRSLKARVELRQIGARDEAKLIGGIGKCGFPLCCTNFLCEFSPVSIKMAKEQEVALNPMKTSGICGRLLCCLGYEYEQYKEIKEGFPSIGEKITTPLGIAKVSQINPIKATVTVILESGSNVEFTLEQLKWTKKSKQ